MKEFLLFCSGANLEVLKQCPTDQSKYAGIGATILLTSLLASLSGGYALFTVFRSVPVAILFGMLWGLIIFNLDRVIVSGMRRQPHRWIDVVYAMPRLLFSVLLAIVISRPLELRLFEAELLQEWQRMENQAHNRDLAAIEAPTQKQLEKLTADNAALNQEIEREEAAYQQAREAWIQEKAGTGGTGIPGAGPVFEERATARAETLQQLEDTKKRNLERIAKNDSLIAGILRERAARENKLKTATEGADGFLARMRAFDSLKESYPVVHLASIFITLLFISLETAPVMVKVLSTFSPYRPYDELLEQREFEIVEKVRQDMRIKRAAMKTDAERTIEDHDTVSDAEMHLNTRREQLRRDAELQANEALMQRVAEAQVEIAGQLVEEWKRRELEKIEQGATAYAQQTP